jgi:hypothetical protein
MGDTTYIRLLALTQFVAKQAGFYRTNSGVLVDEMIETCNDKMERIVRVAATTPQIPSSWRNRDGHGNTPILSSHG